MIAAASLAGLGILIALALLIRGWIGRRIDDHPLCRGCGFDLTGRPATSTRCSECGSDLSPPRAVTMGHQARRWRLIVSGAALLAAAAVYLGVILYLQYSTFNWAIHSPTWLLLRVAHADWTAQSTALTELIARRSTGSLNARQYADLVDAALDAQGRAGPIWDGRWADIIEAAHDAGNVDPQQWQRYARQALDSAQITLVVPSTAEIDGALPFSIECDGARCGSGPVLQLSHEYLCLRNHPLPPCITTCIKLGESAYDGKEYASTALPRDLAPGVVPVRAFVHLAVMYDDQPIVAEDRTFNARLSFMTAPPSAQSPAAGRDPQ